MIKIKNPQSLILAVPVLCFLLLEFYFFYPKSFYFALVLILVLIGFTIFAMAKNSKNAIDGWYNFLILPILFAASATSYTVFLPSKFLIHFIFVIISLFLYFYFKNIYFYLISPRFYRKNALENISSYGNFLVILFTFSTFLGLQLFLGVKVWILALASGLIVCLVTYQVLLANDLYFKKNLIYIFLNSLILIELFWAASFLPLSYKSVGLILAICYYMLIGISRFYLKGKTEEKKIKLYLLFGTISILAVILSSKWL